MASKGKKSDESSSTFEASTKQLEAIIETLEDDGISLEDALKAFEQGISLSRSAQKALEQAEQHVSLLLEEEGEMVSSDMPKPQDHE